MSPAMDKLGIVVVLLLFLEQVPAAVKDNQKEVQRDAVLRDLIDVWRKSGGWSARAQRDPHSVLKGLVGNLKSLGLLPRKSPSLLGKASDRQRLSGFLYNISMYLQEMSAELDDKPFSDEQFWETLLYSLLQTGRDSSDPPRPTIKLQDLFLSVRGSPHWDGLLALIQSVLTLSERQPQKPILTFVHQNWRTISALLETVLQALVSGTYGQAVAGLQGFICVLKGRSDCVFNLGWLEQLLSFLESRNWRPVVSLHPLGVELAQKDAGASTGRFKPFLVPPELLLLNQSDAESLGSIQTLLLQALSRSSTGEKAAVFAQRNPGLLRGLDDLRQGFLRRVGRGVYRSLRRKVSHVTWALLEDVSSVVGEPRGIRHNLTWNAQAMGFSSEDLPSRPAFMSCLSSDPDKPPRRPTMHRFWPYLHNLNGSDLSLSAEILEAACNSSIPGLTGVSNFTVFLYCNLFEGPDTSQDPGAGRYGADLHATCSDAAWYLAAAEEDFLWVHVCSEYFAHEFNRTVCANLSFWLQHARQVEASRHQYLNQSSIDELCLQLSSDTPSPPHVDPTESCLTLLSSPTLTAQDFRRCFLPNNTALVSSLCGNHSSQAPEEGSWAAEYCSKVRPHLREPPCHYSSWRAEQFLNASTLELCKDQAGLRELVCGNISLYLALVLQQPSLLDLCLDPQQKVGSRCVLQRLFDMLPAPYDFDTSRLCVDPVPVLQEAVLKLGRCRGLVEERGGWLDTVGYVLRMLDFVVRHSEGLEEGEREVRQGLGQAILLSSLQDNASFWAALRPDASLSVLHAVAVFLKREPNATLKEDLLSCFSPVLWDLIQREGNSSALRFLIQEYLQMPSEGLRSVVLSAEKDAVKRFIAHVHESWAELHVEAIQVSPKEQEAMETMTAAFIHKFPHVTPELFVNLSQFIPYMSVSDIMTFPASLMTNDSVLMAISARSPEMKPPQKQAFVKRLLQSSLAGDVSSWPPHFLSSILPLLPHLPVSHFQQLTTLQLSPLVEMLGNSSLDATRGRHVIRTVFSRSHNLSADHMSRLGDLVCYLNTEDLWAWLSAPPLSPVLWRQLARCISEGHISGSGRVSHWLGVALRPLNASVLTASGMASLHALLPQMGTSFLETLSSAQILDLLTLPGTPDLPPAQAFQILNKLSEETNLSADTLCRVRALLPGVGPWLLRRLLARGSALDCQCWSSVLWDLETPHRPVLYFALQQALDHSSVSLPRRLRCLLPFVPLRSLMKDLDEKNLLRHVSQYKHMAWSHQQTQTLFRMMQSSTNITPAALLGLGRIAGGMSCDWLNLWVNQSDFSELLQFITKLPGGIRPGLRNCMVAALRKRPDVDVNHMDVTFNLRLPLTMMEKLSNVSLANVLEYVRKHFVDFLKLPPHKQAALAEKAVCVFGIPDHADLSGASMDTLGPLLPFLDRDVLSHVDREALKARLEELKHYCLPWDSLRQISALLTDRSMLGEPRWWTDGDVELVGRLLFTLSTQDIRSLPLADLGRDVIEEVLMSQWLWKDSDVGKACVDLKGLREKINTFIHRIVKRRWWMRRGPTPSCADIKGTFPSAWTSSQLRRMKRSEMKGCVEFLGQDESLDAEQRETLWGELRPAYKPVKLLRAEQLLELGCIVTEMAERELQALNVSDMAVVAHFGSLNGWSAKKMRAVLLGIMKRLKQKPEDLGAMELVSLGHLLCGFTPSEISRLDPFNLSVASLFLGELVLECSEQQTGALTARLSSDHGFGPVSQWGSDIFTEIGTLAAGLEDFLLSALVQEQMEGLTPAAITLIPPRKMAVVFSARQLSWLSSEQASAVSEEQWEELDAEQRQALGMAQYEGEVLLGHRGRNTGPSRGSDPTITTCLLLVCALWLLL